MSKLLPKFCEPFKIFEKRKKAKFKVDPSCIIKFKGIYYAFKNIKLNPFVPEVWQENTRWSLRI